MAFELVRPGRVRRVDAGYACICQQRITLNIQDLEAVGIDKYVLRWADTLNDQIGISAGKREDNEAVKVLATPSKTSRSIRSDLVYAKFPRFRPQYGKRYVVTRRDGMLIVQL